MKEGENEGDEEYDKDNEQRRGWKEEINRKREEEDELIMQEINSMENKDRNGREKKKEVQEKKQGNRERERHIERHKQSERKRGARLHNA